MSRIQRRQVEPTTRTGYPETVGVLHLSLRALAGVASKPGPWLLFAAWLAVLPGVRGALHVGILAATGYSASPLFDVAFISAALGVLAAGPALRDLNAWGRHRGSWDQLGASWISILSLGLLFAAPALITGNWGALAAEDVLCAVLLGGLAAGLGVVVLELRGGRLGAELTFVLAACSVRLALPEWFETAQNALGHRLGTLLLPILGLALWMGLSAAPRTLDR